MKVPDASGRMQVYDGDILARGMSELGQTSTCRQLYMLPALQEANKAWK